MFNKRTSDISLSDFPELPLSSRRSQTTTDRFYRPSYDYDSQLGLLHMIHTKRNTISIIQNPKLQETMKFVNRIMMDSILQETNRASLPCQSLIQNKNEHDQQAAMIESPKKGSKHKFQKLFEGVCESQQKSQSDYISGQMAISGHFKEPSDYQMKDSGVKHSRKSQTMRKDSNDWSLEIEQIEEKQFPISYIMIDGVPLEIKMIRTILPHLGNLEPLVWKKQVDREIMELMNPNNRYIQSIISGNQ